MNMKKIQFKKVFILTSMIFTILVVLQSAHQTAISQVILWQFLAVSVLSALIKYLFFDEVLFRYSYRLQGLYLLGVWLMITGLNTVFRWGMTPKSLLMNAFMVALIYFAIRLIVYRSDKITVKAMNEKLQEKKYGKEK